MRRVRLGPAHAAPAALQRGHRVFLRHPTAGDADEFIALNRASAEFHKGWVSPPTQPEQFNAYLARCGRDDFEGLLVCRRSDSQILGAINLSQIFRGNFLSAYLGYQIGAPYAGQGYMAEAIQLVLRHAFKTLRLHRVEANIQPDNAASIALVRRAGFTLEGFSRRYLKIGGRWRDHERWAMLVEDWRATRRREAAQARASSQSSTNGTVEPGGPDSSGDPEASKSAASHPRQWRTGRRG